MTPEEQAKYLYNKVIEKINSEEQAKELACLYVSETLTNPLVNLTDYQIDFWMNVKKEIKKIQ